MAGSGLSKWAQKDSEDLSKYSRSVAIALDICESGRSGIDQQCGGEGITRRGIVKAEILRDTECGWQLVCGADPDGGDQFAATRTRGDGVSDASLPGGDQRNDVREFDSQ